ncbi:general secretion pathway protein H [Comamonas sp. BIGb0152]|uniref:prepilin-type N-terminal cleavage/methylation domain-containing protein n=1 Tax=Comamonas sp. BIGb0152 TaxID=2940601 RepID=UPI002167C949|nr:prepilin-type N-terminal cleavage/methylation domain-containing protein [Comamonas sp. BIGb0152]MCS4293690.1 general secretion pathway protein H [Comamonas sp. BIGb0152]
MRCSLPPTAQPRRQRGFSLMELLVVISLMALASAGVVFAMGDNSQDQLQREGQRLAAQLEAARAQSRASGQPVRWRADSQGFVIEGLQGGSRQGAWLHPPVAVRSSGDIILGPEALIGPQTVVLAYPGRSANSIAVATDGVRPFALQAP